MLKNNLVIGKHYKISAYFNHIPCVYLGEVLKTIPIKSKFKQEKYTFPKLKKIKHHKFKRHDRWGYFYILEKELSEKVTYLEII